MLFLEGEIILIGCALVCGSHWLEVEGRIWDRSSIGLGGLERFFSHWDRVYHLDQCAIRVEDVVMLYWQFVNEDGCFYNFMESVTVDHHIVPRPCLECCGAA